MIRSLAWEAAVFFSDIAGDTAKRYLNSEGCRWEDERNANPFSSSTVTIDKFCGPHRVWGVLWKKIRDYLGIIPIWVRFPRTGILAKMWSFFEKKKVEPSCNRAE